MKDSFYRFLKLAYLLYWLRVRQTENILSRNSKHGRKTILFYFLAILIFAVLPISLILFQIIVSNRESAFVIVFLLFTSIFAIYQLRPILGLSSGLDFDISKLLPYPIDIKNIIYAGLIGNFFDTFTILIIIPICTIFASLYITFGLGYAITFALCSLIFLFHCFSFSELIVISIQGVSSNQSYKDMLSGLGIILMLLFVCVTQMLPGMFADYEKISSLTHITQKVIWFIPSAYVSNILEGNNPLFFVILLLFVAYFPIPITIKIAERKFYEIPYRRYHTNKNKNRNMQKEMKKEDKRIRALFSHANRQLSRRQSSYAIFLKEWAYLVRDPSRKMVFLSPVLITFVLLINTSYLEFPEMMIYILAMGIPWSIVPQLGQNSLGLEGKNIWLLLSTPCKRESIFIGKNAVIFFAGAIICSLFLTSFCVYFSAFEHMLSSLIFSLCALLLFTGLGNFLSVYFPMRVESHLAKRKYISPKSAMIYMFAGLGLILLPLFLITIPLMASKFAEYDLIPRTFYGLSYIQILYIMLLPTFLYSLYLYKKMLKIAVKKIEAIEPEIVELCS